MNDTRGFGVGQWKDKRVHFIGIGGSGMSGIARVLRAAGAKVSGSDRQASPTLERLKRLGIAVAVGHSADNLPERLDMVVVTAAAPADNVEFVAARRRGTRVWKYARLLGSVTRARECVAVSGAHGKTTTTGMIGFALQESELDPSVVVGGRVRQIGGGGRVGAGPHFVVEACEYDRSFWRLRPKYALINNIEADHMDYYRDMDDLVDAFAGLARRVQADGRLFVNGNDALALRAARAAVCPVETFGMGVRCDWRFAKARREGGRTYFTAYRYGRSLGEFSLGVPGLHNVRNALGAIAATTTLGARLDAVRQALDAYQGADRRLQNVGHVGGVRVLDDYAHHPTEIRATLAAARQECPDARVWCVFQPHQCSRTRLLFPDFVRSLLNADRVIVPDIYSVRDTDADRRAIHAADLVAGIRGRGGSADYIASFDRIVDHLADEAREGDLVITMGAGSVDQVARALVKRLEQRSNVAAA